MRLLLLAALLFLIHPGYSIRKGEPPKINRNIDNNYRIPLGTDYVIFKCPILTNPKNDGVIVSWLKDDEEISDDWPKYKFSNNNRELKVKNPEKIDEGVYTCQAVNGFGHADVQFFLEIYDPNNDIHLSSAESINYATKPSAPIWNNKKTINSPIHLNTGNRLELLCPVIGNPLPEIKWYKNGQFLDMGEIKYHKSAKLQLDDVTRNDSGTYTCRLENRYGSIQDTFIVIVDSSTNSIKKLKSSFEFNELDGEAWGNNNPNAPIIDEPQNATVIKGQSAEFRCHMSDLNTVINPLFRWLKEDPNSSSLTTLTIRNKTFTILEQPENSTVIFNGPKKTKIYSNTLKINYVTQKDSGKYICVITSVEGYVGYRAAQLNVVSNTFYESAINTLYLTVIIVVGIIFILLVASAITWLRCNSNNSEKNSTQSKSTCSTGSDCYPTSFNASTAMTKKTILSAGVASNAPPPPPRIPAPETPNMKQIQKNYLLSLHGTPQSSPFLQQDRRIRPPNSATLDRRYRPQPQQMLHRTYAEDEMSRLSSNIYDSGSPLPPPPSHAGTISSHIYCTTSPKQSRHKRPVDSNSNGYCVDDNYLSIGYRDQQPFLTSSPRW